MKLLKSVAWGLLLAALGPLPLAQAITIRDDKTEDQYIDLSADPRWASAGVYTSTSTCFASGGTLIHPEWAITAGHCLNGSADFVLGADRSNPDMQVDILSTSRHNQYSGGDIANGKDLAVTQLAEPILDVTPMRLYRGNSETSFNTVFVGYGQFGTGLTGDNMGGTGIRRAAENKIDLFGPAAGFSNGVILTDFDNPNNPSNSVFGSVTPLPLEGTVAFYDSGSGWFIETGGVTYLAAVTSFRAATHGTFNSDYGDIAGGTRVSRELTWIDDNHDVTQFWDRGFGNWNENSKWLPGAQPTLSNAAVIDGGLAVVTDVGEIAEYTFVVDTGQLRLQNNFATNYLLLRDGGKVEVDNSSSATTLVGSLRQESDGILEVNIRAGTTVGSGYDQLFVSADAELAGALVVTTASGYDDPGTRGDTDVFTPLTSGNRVGTFDDVEYDGTSLSEGSNYVGTSSLGADGMFRTVIYAGNTLMIENYLALSGDANGDGSVDADDLDVWNMNKFQAGDWTQGDFTGDGFIDGQDLLAWNANKFTSVQLIGLQQVVPEPGALVLLLCGLVALTRCRSRCVRAGS